MAGEQFFDPRTGKPVFVRDGKAFLKDGAGNLFRADPRAAADQILSGEFEPATPDEVQARDVARRAGDSSARAFGESAAAGAFDAATALPRLAARGVEEVYKAAGAPIHGQGRSEDVSGRSLLQAIAADAGDPTGEQYAEEARHRAAESPLAAMGGRVVGELAGGGAVARATGALGPEASLGARAAAGVAEGATLGYAQANEDAYIANHELSADQVLAGIGLGGVLGGGVALGMGGAGRLFGRKGTRGETPFDSPKLGPYRTQDAALEASAEKALGVPTGPGFGEKLRDAIESAQSVVSGADKGTLKNFGPLRWDAPARAGRDMWRNREAILEGAAKQMRADLDELATKSRDVMDEVVDADLKREHIASKITGDATAATGAARAEMGRLVGETDALLADVGTYGNRGVTKRIRQFVGELADETDKTDDAADAFIALDRAKRGLQRWRKQLGRSAARSDDALLRQQADALGGQLERMQERTRNLLMDEGLWGAAAADQRAINQAWENWFQSRQMFHGNFLTKTGDTFDGRGIFVADPNKVSRYVRNLGRQEAALVDDQFRHHVNATQRLAEAIGGAFDLGDKAAQVAGVRAAASRVADMLKRADETVKVANQIDAVIQAENASGASLLGGALGGGLVGGLPGAALGAAFGVVSRPGQLIRQAAAVQALGANVGARMRKSISGYFRGFSAPQLSEGTREAVKKLPAGGRRAATAAAVTGFARQGEDKREAYERRTREVLDMVRSPEIAAERIGKALGPLKEQTPKLAGLIGMRAMTGAAFLVKKIPAPLAKNSLTPHLDEVDASDTEIAEFEDYWQAVSNPMSLLDELKHGTLSDEHVEAVSKVYPALFKEMQAAVIAELAALKKPPPYQARLQLDLMLGLNGAGEESVSPGFLFRQQQRSQATPQSQAPQQARPPASGPKHKLEGANRYQTPMQSVETRSKDQ